MEANINTPEIKQHSYKLTIFTLHVAL